MLRAAVKNFRFLCLARWMTVALILAAGPGPGAPAIEKTRPQEQTPDVVYVGTPYDLVAAMLKLARVKKEDVVYDLGCGDGRMVVLAAKKYGCRAFGFDIDPERVAAAKENVRKNGVGSLVKIEEKDLFKVDFSGADVLPLYLLPEINKRLLGQFEKLKPGARLVFHDYGLEGVEADQTLRITSNEDNATHTLYLYTTPLKKDQ